MAELEDIVKRRNYELKIDWNCEKCGSKTQICGCILPGEEAYGTKELVGWDDLIHKKCTKCGTVTKPVRKCNRCGTIYEFGKIGCTICDEEIGIVIDLQDNIAIIKEQIRRDRRKQLDTTQLEDSFRALIKLVEELKYYPCPGCHIEFVYASNEVGTLKCFECGQSKL